MPNTTFTSPVAGLLEFGPTERRGWEAWPDYVEAFGLEAAHTTELTRMATEAALHESKDPANAWAPVHAWRALGQLRAHEAVVPLLQYLAENEADDTALDELPNVFGLIGAAAIPPLVAALSSDPPDGPKRIVAVEALGQIGKRHALLRAVCIKHLARQLAPFATTEPVLAGFVIGALMDMRAAEAIDAVRDAYARDAVDISIPGDLEDAEIGLGLRTERVTPQPHYIGANWHPDEKQEPSGKIGRNNPCPCGSGKKYKKCCLIA